MIDMSDEELRTEIVALSKDVRDLDYALLLEPDAPAATKGAIKNKVNSLTNRAHKYNDELNRRIAERKVQS